MSEEIKQCLSKIKVMYDENLYEYWTSEEYRRLCAIKSNLDRPHQTKRIQMHRQEATP